MAFGVGKFRRYFLVALKLLLALYREMCTVEGEVDDLENEATATIIELKKK